MLQTMPESLGSTLEECVSPHLLCPISHCLMERPMVAPSGHTYDWDMISSWLSRRPVDPLSSAPLTLRQLYLNRAVQSEIVQQLERVATLATEMGNDALVEAARLKLEAVRAASGAISLGGTSEERVPRLDRLIDKCATWSAQWGEIAREQALVFFTSFGVLMCVLLDVRASYQQKRQAGSQLQAPSPPLLSSFLRLATLVTLPPPRQWPAFNRWTLQSLRGMLLLPLGPLLAGLLAGSLLSVAKYGKRFLEVRAVELERAAQDNWWIKARDLGSGITGITSFLLFIRVYMDS